MGLQEKKIYIHINNPLMMKKEVLICLLVLFILGCNIEENKIESNTNNINQKFITNETKELEPQIYTEKSSEFRLEIPTQTERETLPECDGLSFTTFPVNISEVREITPLGNLGPPGHTFPTDHPHLHVGEHDSGKLFDIYAPADVYLTMTSWSSGMSQDPLDYTIYFALCKDVIGYYNHVKTVSNELQDILDNVECERFSQGSGCTKVLNLNKFEEGRVMGTVGQKQGNFDFGLIDLRVNLSFVNPERYPERSKHIQCPFDYYPTEMKNTFYNLINRYDKRCSGTMQDVPGTLKGNWFHESAQKEKVVQWDVYLAFVEDYEFSNVQVVSVAGKFTDPSLYHFRPKNDGNINRNFSQVTPGEIYCYQSEEVGKYQLGNQGKIVLKMIDQETLEIEHQSGNCVRNEVLSNPEVYRR
mgnify:CR=1 FL=1